MVMRTPSLTSNIATVMLVCFGLIVGHETYWAPVYEIISIVVFMILNSIAFRLTGTNVAYNIFQLLTLLAVAMLVASLAVICIDYFEFSASVRNCSIIILALVTTVFLSGPITDVMHCISNPSQM